MKLAIKNMVCNRCVAAVNNELKQMGYNVQSVTMGEAVIEEEPARSELEKVATALQNLGFELLDDKKSTLIENIKTLIIQQVHHLQTKRKVNYSTLISEGLGKDYSYLSKLFSETEGITIEQFIILQKIEKVKELLVYGELSLSEIADDMDYSSVAHLSAQFKKVTGFTPSHFKSIRENKRISLDKVNPRKM